MPELISPITDWVYANLPWIVLAVVMHLTVLLTVAYLILLERKIASWTQDRIGPNRTGFGFGIIPILKDYRALGLGQSFADGLKMFTKEDYRSPNSDKVLFTIAPMIMMAVVIISIAVIPWGGTYGHEKTVNLRHAVDQNQSLVQAVKSSLTGQETIQSGVRVNGTIDGQPFVGHLADDGKIIGTDEKPIDAGLASELSATYTAGWRFQIASLNVGVIYILAVLGLAVYGVVIGGYASNNKYSFLGGLRATANMVSYEIPLGISILVICLMYGSFDLHDIVNSQAKYWIGVIPAWNVFAHPVTFVLFLICIHAEANRAPFDTAECEQELVGGYHTEYGSMRMGLFFLAEYAGIITTSAICVALFFGGWHVPFIDYIWPALSGTKDSHATDSLLAGVVRVGCFFFKTLCVVAIFMWTRWSLPRFRFDQIMGLAWKILIPISLGLLVATTVGVVIIVKAGGTPVNGLSLREAALFLAMNVVVVAVTLVIGAALKIGQGKPNHRIAVPNSRYAATGA
jgi:NADH-quinone oxidoreductase subunit H